MFYWFEKALLSLPFTLDNPYFFQKKITLTFSLLFRGRALESLNKSYSKYIIKLLEPFQFNHPGSMVFLILKLAI